VTLEFDALATDLESPNDILGFSLDPDAPEGATIDPITGRFRWTPAEHHGPGEYSIPAATATVASSTSLDFPEHNSTGHREGLFVNFGHHPGVEI
jgi:hypothetical protein